MTWLVALSGAIPAIVALWIVDRRDGRDVNRPTRLRRRVVLFGALAVGPALGLEILLANLGVVDVTDIFTAFVAAAVEEACKLAVISWFVWRRPELDDRIDGIIYATRAGLGFALVAHLTHLAIQPSGWLVHACFAVPGHVMWSGMIGAAAARQRFDGKGLGLAGGFLLATAFHGAYDAAVLVGPMVDHHVVLVRALTLAPVVLTIVACIVLRTMVRTALRLDDVDAVNRAINAARVLARFA